MSVIPRSLREAFKLLTTVRSVVHHKGGEEKIMFPTALFVLLAAVLTTPAQTAAYIVPDFHDLTIRLRETHSSAHPQLTNWYFKGPRQRRDDFPEDPNGTFTGRTLIGQCDQKTMLALDSRNKTFSLFPVPAQYHSTDSSEINNETTAGPRAVMTFNSVDTGERRRIGNYEARRIKTMITVEPSEDAVIKLAVAEADSWYLNLPGLNCSAVNPRYILNLVVGLLVPTKGQNIKAVVRRTGVDLDGLLIEEIYTSKIDGKLCVSKTELLGVSELPLHESLFEVPTDYKRGEVPGYK